MRLDPFSDEDEHTQIFTKSMWPLNNTHAVHIP